MDTVIYSARDISDQEWDALRALYVKAFVSISASLSACDLALMGNNPKQFWAGVFDYDKPRSHEKNYTFIISKEDNVIISYGLYAYMDNARYLYIHHFVVHPDYQGRGLGRKLMETIQNLHVDAQKTGLLTRTYNLQAQNFYKRLGFAASLDVPDSVREYYSSDRVYMECVL